MSNPKSLTRIQTGNATVDRTLENWRSILDPALKSLYSPAYGEIWDGFAFDGSGLSLTIVAGGLYYKLPGLVLNISDGSNVVFGESSLKIAREGSGVYKVLFFVAFAGPSETIASVIFKNGTEISPIHSSSKINSNQDEQTMSASGLIRLNAGDEIDLRLSSTNNNKVLTMDHVGVTISRIGP